MDFILSTTKLVLQNWQEYLYGGLVVVSLIIFFMGCFKKLVLDRVKNKELRGFLCAIISLIFSFPATSLYFFTENISFDYYWYGYAVFSILTILVYWFYEHFGARQLLHFLGSYTWSGIKSVFNKVFVKAISDEKVDIKEELSKELKTTLKTSKDTAKKAVSKVTDKDLKNL